MKKNRKKFDVKAVDGSGEVEAVFATLNVIDKDGDVTEPGAFGDQEAPIQPSHNWDSPALGKALISEEGEEAIARMKFNLESEAGREWFSALKFDFENGTPKQEYSYGFNILDSGQGEFKGEPVRFLKSLKVLEVSPVLVGAGENTRTLAVKAGVLSTLADEFRSLEESLADFSGLYSRLKALAALRAKEGRTLSAQNRQRLSRLLDAVDEIRGEVSTFLQETAPAEDDDGKAAELFVRYQKAKLETERLLRS